MRLLEYQAKSIFAQHGLTIPAGETVRSSSDVASVLERIRPPLMVKTQVRAGGRGKAGAVMAASTVAEAQEAVQRLLGSQVQGHAVRAVLLEERLPVAAEYYLGVLTDRAGRCPLALVSASGGVEVEAAASAQGGSGTLAQLRVDPVIGLRPYQARDLARQAGLPLAVRSGAAAALLGLYRAYQASDALYAEVNPLVLTQTGRLIAADARLDVDDNALFRQSRLAALQELDAVEERVQAEGFHYVPMNGDIGLVSTGSGACMAIMDLLGSRGGRPANFIELGQSMGTGGTQAAMDILLDRPDLRVILVAGYSGGPLDRLAGGVLEVLGRRPDRRIPVVVRVEGRNQDAARDQFLAAQDDRLHVAASYLEAVELAARLAEPSP